MFKDAILDQSRKYRYVLKRQWGADDKNFVNFVLLNPSTADETKDDRTITACIKLAQNFYYDGLYVTNLFAFRATKPGDLKKFPLPIGEENDKYLQDFAKKSKAVVIAWGNHGDFLNRAQEVIKILTKIQVPYCLAITKRGSPKHPLYTKRIAEPFPFRAAHLVCSLASIVMDEVACPKCGSAFVQKQTGYAAVKHEGQPAGSGHVIPNECREKDCRHKWHDKE